jgi:hypothetical protein
MAMVEATAKEEVMAKMTSNMVRGMMCTLGNARSDGEVFGRTTGGLG